MPRPPPLFSNPFFNNKPMNIRARLLSIVAFLCVISAFSGCATIGLSLYRVMGTGMDTRLKLKHPETGREIVMIGMIHLERPEFFEEIRLYLDSIKREDGYVVFYEKVGREGIDSMRLDTLLRKFRRVVGIDLRVRDENLMSQKKFVMQSLSRLGLTTNRDIRVDMTWDEMITEYEKRYEEIVLTDYDWQTPLTEKYKRRKSGKQEYSSYPMLHTIRNEYIFEKMEQSPHQKIALIYGKWHWWFIYPKLEDAGYRIVEGKPYRSWEPDYD